MQSIAHLLACSLGFQLSSFLCYVADVNCVTGTHKVDLHASNVVSKHAVFAKGACLCCRTLKTWHKVASDKVIALMNHDLVNAKGKWAAGIKELREMFIRVEQDGFSMQSQAVWRLHWDHQIYKVCHAYVYGKVTALAVSTMVQCVAAICCTRWRQVLPLSY